MPNKSLYSTAEVAKILRLSRIEVFRKIKAGKIDAEKIGRNYVISHNSLAEALGRVIGKHKRFEIDKTISRAMGEYGEALKKLAKE